MLVRQPWLLVINLAIASCLLVSFYHSSLIGAPSYSPSPFSAECLAKPPMSPYSPKHLIYLELSFSTIAWCRSAPSTLLW